MPRDLNDATSIPYGGPLTDSLEFAGYSFRGVTSTTTFTVKSPTIMRVDTSNDVMIAVKGNTMISPIHYMYSNGLITAHYQLSTGPYSLLLTPQECMSYSLSISMDRVSTVQSR